MHYLLYDSNATQWSYGLNGTNANANDAAFNKGLESSFFTLKTSSVPQANIIK